MFSAILAFRQAPEIAIADALDFDVYNSNTKNLFRTPPMLNHISLSNYVIADQLELELNSGMSALTGETGAGKSLILDALGLTLGDRTDASIIKAKQSRAEITASFNIEALPDAITWLQQRDLDSNSECVLRRVITREGRSRAYINGRISTLQDLKSLGSHLVDIHSQHAHQSLLKKATQRRLLDEYAGSTALSIQTQQLAKELQRQSEQLQQLRENSAERSAQSQLLQYQVDELDTLNLQEGELQKLDTEHKLLANAEQNLHSCHQVLTLCQDNDDNIISLLQSALAKLEALGDASPALKDASQLLDSAKIQTEEAVSYLQQHVNNFQADPEALGIIESRLSAIHDMARKHRVDAPQLTQKHQELSEQLATLSGSEEDISLLEQALATLQSEYQNTASKLSAKRQKAAKKLEKRILEKLHSLSMSGCRFTVALHQQEKPFSTHGAEDIEFLISTNPEQEPQALNRIASGGELSRISLAIQVVTAETSQIPTLVFDEVDVGIGGATAEIVGALLHDLGSRGQVICVTHQAQVAAKADQHYIVSKNTSKSQVSSTIKHLDQAAQITEIARMLGGIELTKQTLAHAEEMLNTA